MASDRVLIWFVGLSLFFTFVRAEGIVWRRIAAFFLVVSILGLSTFGEPFIYFVAPVWFGLLFMPRLALWQLKSACRELRWEKALFCANVLQTLYPGDEWLQVMKLLRGHEQAASGNAEKAQQYLQEVRLSRSFVSRHPFLLPLLDKRAEEVRAQSGSLPSSFFLTATGFLLMLHTFLFVAQELVDALYRKNFSIYMGGLLTTLVLKHGEYWRILSNIFLHAGFVHFASNMFGLYILGPFVERTLGVKRFLSCYFLSGIGSSLFIILLTVRGVISEAFSIGASGAVLGMVGSTAAIFCYAYYKHRDIAFLQQLKSVGLILVIQTAFDLTTPQVSFAAHSGGVITGLLITFLMLFVKPFSVAQRRV